MIQNKKNRLFYMYSLLIISITTILLLSCERNYTLGQREKQISELEIGIEDLLKATENVKKRKTTQAK